MTTKDGVRSAALALLIALVGVPAAHAAQTKLGKPTGAPASIEAGKSFSVKVKVTRPKKGTKVTFVLSKDARADRKDIKLTGTLKARKTQTLKGKLTIPKVAKPGTYRLIACAGKTCAAAAKKLKVTRAPRTPTPTQQPGPPARPAPGNEQLPPGPEKPGQKPDPIPKDPELAAPPLDPGAATSVYDATSFLYTGTNPIQRGVKPGAIEPTQVAVLKGRVTDREQRPIKGVRVTVLDHPELGMTNTRDDGQFDLAVNGGGVTLSFETAGFLPVQRTFAPNWQDYEALTDVVMVPVDPSVTTIDPNSAAPFQVVQGTETKDQDGERQGTLLVPKGTGAVMELPNGTVKELQDPMKVRITEFTYGPLGDEAMPGSLPANSGYTYAAEFSVDEALKAGAQEVRFNKPLINYTENFIGAPVGSPVPTGYYDRETGEWKASKNGRVIKVLANGVDTDGDGTADNTGISDAERQRLAALYQPGQELWRVEITHFTPWDHNWPYGPPPGAKPPKLKEFEWQDPNDPCRQKGSEIGCETQTLGESLPVTGTEMTLNYSSDRTPGWKVGEEIEIPVVGEIPPRLKGIQLTIDVAGERFEKRWCDPNFPTTGETTCKGLPAITPNISHRFRWDGLDAYDRKIHGRATATIRVVYVYEFNYYEASEDFSSSFAQFGSDTEVMDGRYMCGNVSRTMDTHFFCGIPIGQTITRAIGSWDARAANALGGWSLSDHHAYDPVEKSLHRGDGSTVRADALPPVAITLAGTTRRGVGGGEGSANFPREGEPGPEANIDYMGDYVRSPDGNLYFHNGLNRNHIFRLSRDGKVYTFAGNGSKDRTPTGDGGPARQAALGVVSALATSPDGSLLIAGYSDDMYAQQIRRVTPDGSRIETIAGNTNRTAPLGDGKPALEAHIGSVYDMAVGPDGTIYWTERYSGTNNWKGRLRKLSPDGIVTTVAGGGDKPADNGTPASEVILGADPKGLAIGADGSLYVALQYDRKVIRIAPDGAVTRFAGKGIANERGKIETGKPAAESYIDSPVTVAAATDGSVYIRTIGYDVSPSSSAILRVDGEGILQQHAGRLRGTCGAGAPDGEAATSVCMQNHSVTIGVDADDNLTFADGRYLLRKVAAPLPGFDPDGLALPSSDGLEVYEFDRNGRHLRTRDGFTGTVLKTFEYDAAKRLTGIVDPFGNRTRIERAGATTSIIAPGGQRTTLAIDDFVQSVTNPAGETHSFSYHGATGLLASYKRPEGGTTRFDYNAAGRLVRHRGADGEERTLTRVDGERGPRVTIRTAGGLETVYAMEVLADGSRRRTVTQPSGAKTTSTARTDGVTELVEADGTTSEIEYGADPRWGASVPIVADETVTTPDGKQTRIQRTDTVGLRDVRDPFSITQLRSTFKEGSKSATWTYADPDPAKPDDQTVTARTAEGRETVTSLDRYSRVTKQTLGTGVAPLEYGYDAQGRLTTFKQGAELTTFGYDQWDRLINRRDAAGNATAYVYDDAGRLTVKRLPGNRSYRYTYDADGSVATMITPRGKTHTFTVTAGGRPDAYTPPSSTSYKRSYSTEKQLEDVRLPSGALQDMGYDAAGRLTSEDHVQSRRTFGYDGELDRFSTVERTLAGGAGKQALTYGYDGLMPKSLEFTGAAAGRYDYTIGERLLPAAETLTVGDAVYTRALEFDGDRLPTKSGPFTLERTGPSGAVSKITDGKLALTFEYDANGRPAGRKLSVNGAERFYQKLTFGNTGRADKREERVDGGALDTLAYGYDGAGQLLTVSRGGGAVETHTYDPDGNRLDGGAAYDDQDRLTTRAGITHQWDADGFLTARGADTFTWSRSGELLSAGTTTYTYDAFGRRTAAGATKYLYGNPKDMLQVTATIDGAGVVSTYHYDTDGRVYAVERAGERYYVATDAVGSPRLVIRASDGATVRRVEYDSYGVELSVTGAFDLALGYAGGLRDAATGFVRFGMRDYDPAAGRFVARDPSFFRGSPENLYAYADNNPITQKDPTGLACGGFTFYGGVGGGIQLCRDNKIEKASWSVCVEGGVGGGSGFEGDALSGAQDSSFSFVAEATAKLGWVGGTIGGELDLDCFNGKLGAKVLAGPVQFGADTGGGRVGGLAQTGLHGKLGAKLEGKLAIKGCKKF